MPDFQARIFYHFPITPDEAEERDQWEYFEARDVVHALEKTADIVREVGALYQVSMVHVALDE